MTTVQHNSCIFCKESFDSKKELQVHFRKHGDPNFNKNIKNTKSPLSSEMENAGDKCNEEIEMVNCDVCSEVFPTISKAITHKHKVHPDHDAKYFCSWCGKLFTMKHLYNKHIQTSHESEEVDKEIRFFCDCCEVQFFTPGAMFYHNKFFHRQDTELAVVGHSRKMKHFDQELLPIYFCPFCGEEYINKINLNKHMSDEHGDENQCPDDILRCPLCDAVFYHLDAYELHLTYHSSEDLYSEDNEFAKEITEFSLETVAPVMEKVENDTQDDGGNPAFSMGIEELLQQAMNESNDNDNSNSEMIEKKKKRKKHKKSKKSAITLDEFLNMNKDVFGEGIDFQGIEEVPSQVVAKQLKSKKQPSKYLTKSKLMQSSELQKLKKQGIVIKMQPGRNKNRFVGLEVKQKTPNKHVIVSQNTPKTVTQTNTNEGNPIEVLSKLLNQTTQLKIVKKAIQDSNLNEVQTKDKEYSGDTKTEDQSLNHPDSELRLVDVDSKVNSTNKDQLNKDDTQKQTESPEHEVDNNMNDDLKIKNTTFDNYGETTSSNNNLQALRNISQHVTIKPFMTSDTVDEEVKNKHENESYASDSDNVDTHDSHHNNAHVETPQKEKDCITLQSIDKLKHLGHHLTIKSTNQKNNSSRETSTTSMIRNMQCQEQIRIHKNEDVEDSDKDEIKKLDIDEPKKIETNIDGNTQTNQSKDKIKSIDKLKHLSHLITVKPTNPTNNSPVIRKNILMKKNLPQEYKQLNENESSKGKEKEIDIDKTRSDEESYKFETKTENVSEQDKPDINFTNKSKNMPVKPSTPTRNSPPNISRKNSIDPSQTQKTLLIHKNTHSGDSDEEVDFDETDNNEHYDSSDVKDNKIKYFDKLKHLNNSITVKQTQPNPKIQEDMEHYESTMDEFGDIDENMKSDVVKGTPTKSLNPLKSLTKHITIKSSNKSNLVLDDYNEDNETKASITNNSQARNTITYNKTALSSPTSQSLGRIVNFHNSYKNIKNACSPTNTSTIVEQQKTDSEINTQKAKASNILRKLPNITAKPLNTVKHTNNQVPQCSSVNKSSTQALNIMKTEAMIKGRTIEEESKEIEIFNIDDSDDEAPPAPITKQETGSKPTCNDQKKTEVCRKMENASNVFKNISRHITNKSDKQQTSWMNEDVPESEDIYHAGNVDDSNTDFSISNINKMNKKHNAEVHDKLKHLNNVSIKSINQSSKIKVQNCNNSHELEKESGSNVVITEVDDIGGTINQGSPNVIVQFPKDSDSDFDDDDFDDYETEKTKPTSTLKKQFLKSNIPTNLNNLKNISNHLTIKSLNKNIEAFKAAENKSPPIPNVGKVISVKPSKQEDSNCPSEDSDFNDEDDFDIESHIKTNTLGKQTDIPKPNQSPKLSSLKNINSSITIKSFKNNNLNDEDKETVRRNMTEDNPVISNQCRELVVRPCKQIKPTSQNEITPSRHTGHVMNQSIKQKVSSSHTNTVNKEVTVKTQTVQTKTVIQEITTTVTRTIRTVNQSVHQGIQNTSRIRGGIIPQTIVGTKPSQQIGNMRGMKVRQASPGVGTKIRNAPPQTRPTVGTIVRPANQMVPVRPGINVSRSYPRMPVKKPMDNPDTMLIGKPLKISPNAVVANCKRPSEESQGPFSCFKKSKESLIPDSNIFDTAKSFHDQGESTAHFASSSHVSKSNFTNTTKIVKGNSIVTTSQMKTKTSACSEQLSRLNNTSALKVAKTSVSKQETFEEKSDINAQKRTTLEAIEKLQKQGLLVKKPRLEQDDCSEHSNSGDDEYCET